MDYSGSAIPKLGKLKKIDYNSGAFALPKGKVKTRGTAVGRRNRRESAKVDLSEQCQWCVREVATERHHMVSRGRGGANDEGNIISVCPECHRFLHANPLLATPARLVEAKVRYLRLVQEGVLNG